MMSEGSHNSDSERPVVIIFIAVLNGGALIQSYVSGGLLLAFLSIFASLLIVTIYYRRDLLPKWKAWIGGSRRKAFLIGGVLAAVVLAISTIYVARHYNDIRYAKAEERWNRALVGIVEECAAESRFVDQDAILGHLLDSPDRLDACDTPKQDAAALAVRACAIKGDCHQVDGIKAVRENWAQIPKAALKVEKREFMEACLGGIDNKSYQRLAKLSSPALHFPAFGVSVSRNYVRDPYYIATSCDDPRTDEVFRNSSCRGLGPEEQRTVCEGTWQRVQSSFRRIEVLSNAVQWHDAHAGSSNIFEKIIYGKNPHVPGDLLTAK